MEAKTKDNQNFEKKTKTYKISGVESKERPPRSMGYLNMRK